MIGKLAGTVDSQGDGWVIVDVGGVGYLVHASTRTLGLLAPAGKPARLLVETRVNDERIVLYGFHDAAERDWFRLLLSIQGVGPRVALAVLGVLGPDGLARAAAAGDKAAVTRAHGVGPKLAQRIVVELKDKVGESLAVTGGTSAVDLGPGDEAISALVNLGYSHSDAYQAVTGAARSLGPAARLEDLVRAGLRDLAR
ncbi:MAG: Holliday junction branch migration protein RuvA [Alphaproteobacteria bacterium]